MKKAIKEIDFIVRDKNSMTDRLIQVCYELSDDETKEREFSALREAKSETGIADCTIVTDDEEFKTVDGIRVVPAWKWLLMDGKVS